MSSPRRRVLCAIVIYLLCLAPVAHASEAPAAPPAPPTAMQAGVLLDMESGKVLWARDEGAVRAPASLTKVLTALVALENSPLDKVGVISNAARGVRGQRMFAEEGWTMPVGDMLWGLLLQSGNDAAIALAETVSPDGTVQGFMNIANARAAELGAKDTHFVNPHGLDEPGHQTTARDLALLSSAALSNPTLAQMVSSKTHVVPWGDGTNHLFINHNKLLWRYPGAVGIKTGFTSGAGHCLISAVHRDGHTLIAVVMGSPNHYAESTALYDWGFANLAALNAASTTTIRPDLAPATVQLDGGAAESAAAAEGVQMTILIPALGIVCLIALGMGRRYSLYLSRL